jgi:hypothetical protein
MLGFVYYFTVAVLPIVWVVTSSYPRWLQRNDRPLHRVTLVLCYLLPNLFVWACALGVLDGVDTFVFSAWTYVRWCEQLLGQRVGGCSSFEPFLIDTISVVFLVVAATSFWLRSERPAWLHIVAFLALYVLALEEIDYKPFSLLVTSETDVSFSLHDQARSLMTVISNAANFGVPIFIVAKGALVLAKRCWPVSTGRLSSNHLFLGYLNDVSIIHGFGVYLSIVSTHFLLDLNSSEHDKYRDFDQLMVYVGLTLASLELPTRKVEWKYPDWVALLLTITAGCLVSLAAQLVLR